jgi:hypothetical protein
MQASITPLEIGHLERYVRPVPLEVAAASVESIVIQLAGSTAESIPDGKEPSWPKTTGMDCDMILWPLTTGHIIEFVVLVEAEPSVAKIPKWPPLMKEPGQLSVVPKMSFKV